MALGAKKALSSFDKLKIMRQETVVADLDVEIAAPEVPVGYQADHYETDTLDGQDDTPIAKQVKRNASSFDKIRVINRKSNSSRPAWQRDNLKSALVEEVYGEPTHEDSYEPETITNAGSHPDFASEPAILPVWEKSADPAEKVFEEAHRGLNSVIMQMEGEDIANEVKDCARALHKIMFSPVARRFLPHVSNFIYQ